MSEKLVWLLAFVALYWVFCLYWGFAAARIASDARSFFLADRNLPAWVFVLAGTGASFSGWMYFGHPELVHSGGFPAATLALAAITIPLGGVVVMKRQWMLGKHFGYVTPVEMIGEYYDSEAVRLLVLLVAVTFAVPFVGVQLGAAAALFAAVTDGAVDRTSALWLTSAVLFAYVCFGGLRAAAYVGALQALLLGAGVVGLGVVVYWNLGGFGAFNLDLARMSEAGIAVQGSGEGGSFSFFRVPGVIQFRDGIGWENPDGGIWTSVMILSYAVGLMGLQLAPSFGMLGFAARSPKGFRAQQTWAAGAVMGVLLLVFAAAQGFGIHFLGANTLVTGAGLEAAPLIGGRTDVGVVASLTALLGTASPWFLGLFAVCALAAAQGLAALTLSTTSTMLVRDVYRRYVEPGLDVPGQQLYARITMALLLVVTLLMESFAPAAEAALGSLAIGFGVQLLPVLVGLCWLPWITPPAAVTGLATGLVFVVFTDNFGIDFARFFGLELPWGRWPWTIHSAGWGLLANMTICFLISLISQRRDDRARRQPYHDFLAGHAGLAPNRHVMRPVAWAGALGWLFFAVGPGVLFGNFAFGDHIPGGDGWVVGIPPLWGWQFLWWALGVMLLWFLATRMRMSTVPVVRIDLLPRSQRSPSTFAGGGSAMARSWFWIIVAIGATAVLLNWMFG